MVRIQNKYLSVGINSKGAELASIIQRSTGVEYMWQADPRFWGRHSCILFPVVGQMNNDTIHCSTKPYPMLKHGIVRDLDFQLKEQHPHRAIFMLESNEYTLKYFPFDFRLEAVYSLIENTVHIDYIVHNISTTDMPFCIGAHPAFNCPLFTDEKRNQYSLEWELPEYLESKIINEKGLVTERTKLVFENENSIRIADNLFDEDALIFSNMESSYISIVNMQGKKILNFYFDNFSQFGIWSKNKESPFVCLEPWNGMADSNNFVGELADKEGAINLAKGQSWTCTQSIEILDLTD